MGAFLLIAASCGGRGGGKAFLGGIPEERVDPARAKAAAKAYLAAEEAVLACADPGLAGKAEASAFRKADAAVASLARLFAGKGPRFKAEAGRIAAAEAGVPPGDRAAALAAYYGTHPRFAELYDKFIETIGGTTE